MKISESRRVAAALEALALHTARETDLQRRYEMAVESADALASELGGQVLEDPGREAKAAGELARARAAVEVLGAGVARAEAERLRLQHLVALARAIDCREQAAALRKEHERITRAVERAFSEVERVEGVRPADLPSGSTSDRLWREFSELEATAQALEADPASGYTSVVATLAQEREGAAA